MVMSVKEARNLLGDDGANMGDVEIEELVNNLEILARYALRQSQTEREVQKDAAGLAELIYDCHQEGRGIRSRAKPIA